MEKLDPRVKVIPLTGYSWDTYSHLEEKGILDEVETVPWENGGTSVCNYSHTSLIYLDYSPSPVTLHYSYTTHHHWRTACRSVFPQHSRPYMALQIWPCAYEFYYGQVDLGCGLLFVPPHIDAANCMSRLASGCPSWVKHCPLQS